MSERAEKGGNGKIAKSAVNVKQVVSDEKGEQTVATAAVTHVLITLANGGDLVHSVGDVSASSVPSFIPMIEGTFLLQNIIGKSTKSSRRRRGIMILVLEGGRRKIGG